MGPAKWDAMINRPMLSVAVVIALFCGGCMNSTSIETNEYALHVYESDHAGKRGGTSVSIVGLAIVREPDRSLVVFPSGRREPLGTAPAPSDTPDFVSLLFSPPMLDPIHRLPAVLSADIRRRREPDTTDAFRAAWALLAADHIPIQGETDRFRFVGWIRLTNKEWTMLFDAAHDAKTAPRGETN